MDDSTRERYKMFSRIKQTSDGIDFIEFLKVLSHNNYMAFKASPTEMNDVHKGQAIAIDELIKVFEVCDHKLNQVDSSLTNPY